MAQFIVLAEHDLWSAALLVFTSNNSIINIGGLCMHCWVVGTKLLWKCPAYCKVSYLLGNRDMLMLYNFNAVPCSLDRLYMTSPPRKKTSCPSSLGTFCTCWTGRTRTGGGLAVRAGKLQMFGNHWDLDIRHITSVCLILCLYCTGLWWKFFNRPGVAGAVL